MDFIKVSGSNSPIVSLEEMKSHLRIDGNDSDFEILSYINVATDTTEHYTNSLLTPQLIDIVHDDWQSVVKIYLYPITSIESIIYIDANGIENILPPEYYSVNLKSKPTVIHFNKIPSIKLYPTGAITIKVNAGYTSTTDIPQGIIHAIKLLTSRYYENREPQKGDEYFPTVVKALLDPYRLRGNW